MTVVSDTFVFDPWDVSWRDHRTVETIDTLVSEHPVYPLPDGSFVISRYADVREIMNDHDRFTAAPNQSQLIGFPPRLEGDQDPEMLQRLQALLENIPFDMTEFASANVIVGVDPPLHTRIRNIVNRGFVPRRIRGLEAGIDAIVEGCLRDLTARDSLEVVEEFAVPVPIRVIGNILGVPPEQHDDLKRWSDVLSTCVHGESRGTAEAAVNLIGMLLEFGALFMPMIEQRRADPGDDLISDMVRAEETDTLSVAEAVLFLIVLMAAANETTTSLIGNTTAYLLQDPEQLKLVLDSPALVDGANEESLRLSCPVQFVYRAPKADVEIQGVSIPAGSPLICFLAGANRDPQQFPNPHHYDVTRRTHHLAFGHGAHFCLGANLGRIEGRKAIQALAPHLPDFRLDESRLRLDRSAFTRAYQEIHLVRNS
jgi:cytochrome P450